MIIVQIGCYRYVDPHILEYAKDKNNEIYLVDMNISALLQIRDTTKNYPNITIVCRAIDDKDGNSSAYFTGHGVENDYIASLDKNHLLKHNSLNPQVSIVKTQRLKSFLDELKIDKVDILYVDAESLEPKILSSILEDGLDIRTIVFETLHFSVMPILQKFKEKGYVYHHLDDSNGCFMRLPLFMPL